MKKNYGVQVAKSAGFCPGVKKAIDKVLELEAAGKKPIYTLGPLIHNKQVTDTLEAKGITSIEKLDGAKDKNGVLVIRAHGITPQFQSEVEAAGMEVCDATCPLVKHVHEVISKYANLGYDTVIAGDAGHAEVIGLLGYTRGRGHVVANAKEAKKLPPFKKVNIVAQTTQQQSVFEEISAVISAAAEEAAVSNTICHPTKQRQAETMELAKNADMVIVVGGRHSANTTRLAALCGELAQKVILIENETELAQEDLKTPKEIFITAGASTPSWVIDKVYEYVKKERRDIFYLPQSVIKSVWSFIIKSSLYTSFAAIGLTYVAMKLQGILFDPRMLLLAWCFVFSLTAINRTASGAITEKSFKLETAAGLLIGIAGMATAYTAGTNIFVLTALFWLLGVLYPFRYYLKIKKLTSLPGTKDIVTALGWAFVCVYVPAHMQGAPLSKASYLAVFYVVLLVFIRSVLLGIGAANKDIMIGKESFYKAYGIKKTRAAVGIIWGAITAVLAALLFLNWKVSLVTMLLLGNLYTAAVAAFCCFRQKPGSMLEETLVDGQFYILAVLAFAARFI